MRTPPGSNYAETWCWRKWSGPAAGQVHQPAQVREWPNIDQRFIEVVGRVGAEGISRTQVARELGIGYATLKRSLDAQVITEASTEFGRWLETHTNWRRRWVKPRSPVGAK